jgi:hypothetical protein
MLFGMAFLLVFTGTTPPQPDVLFGLYQHGYTLMLAPQLQQIAEGASAQQPDLVILALDSDAVIRAVSAQLHRQAIPWIVWNAADDPALALSAYVAGASAVLPSATSVAALAQCIQVTLAAHTAGAIRRAPNREPVRQIRYRRGDTIRLDDGDVLDVTSGVIAQTMIHQDGSEVLLGLSGVGQTLLGHPGDACCLHLHAHSDAVVVVRSWAEAAADATLPDRLRARVRLIEAWAAMQARAHLDQRILGILSILGEQFGTPHVLGLLVDVRITHAQLASAVGATRSTITRLLGDLKVRGVLTTVGSGEHERYCLHTWESMRHLRPRAEVAVSVHAGKAQSDRL